MKAIEEEDVFAGGRENFLGRRCGHGDEWERLERFLCFFLALKVGSECNVPLGNSGFRRRRRRRRRDESAINGMDGFLAPCRRAYLELLCSGRLFDVASRHSPDGGNLRVNSPIIFGVIFSDVVPLFVNAE